MSIGVLVALVGILIMIIYIVVRFYRLYQKSKPKT